MRTVWGCISLVFAGVTIFTFYGGLVSATMEGYSSWTPELVALVAVPALISLVAGGIAILWPRLGGRPRPPRDWR